MGTVITGAASGIGEALVKLFAGSLALQERPPLLLADRDAGRLAAVVSEYGPNAMALACDLVEPTCGETIATTALDHMGVITNVVSNAGVIRAGGLLEIDVATFDQTFAVNTRATWLLAKACYPHIKAAGGGSIVATASLAASHATPPLGAYAASKAALVMLIKQMANEFGPDGIRCNCVSPGPTFTPMNAAGYADRERVRQREAAIPLRRISEARDIANSIAFLLSPEARQITGIDLLVDGGMATTLATATGTGSGQG